MARRFDARQRQLRRPCEVEKIGHHLAERLRLGANALDVRPVRRGQHVQIEQLAVSVNRRQAVAEFVRDARRQLADGRQAVLQQQLLLEVLHRGQVREETNRAVQLFSAPKSGDTVTPRWTPRPTSDSVTPRRTIGMAVFRHSSMTSSSGCSRGDGTYAVESGSSRIRRPAGLSVVTSPFEADHERAGRQARDDLAAQPLRRFGARGHRAFLQSSACATASWQGGREQRHFGAGRS